MSKTTKIVAALGIVAGLGVAALPAFTYAAQPQSVNGDVDLYVEVLPAIAMTITGNNDDNYFYGTRGTFTAAEPAGTENPSQLGWYEESPASSGRYIMSTDTTVDNSKTYYTRTGNDNATVRVKKPSTATTINGVDVSGYETETALKASSTYTSLLPNSKVEGGDFKSDITVYTNSMSGYDLTVIDSDQTTALTQIIDPESGATADTIPVTETTTLTPGSAAWGFRVSTTSDWRAMPASTGTAAPIKSTSTKTSGGDATTVEYGVATRGDQATGVYTDTITYTATTH